MEKNAAPEEQRTGAVARQWTRIVRPEPVGEQAGWSVQDKGEEEAMRDLEKPIHQLLADVHEQGFKTHTAKLDAENIIHAVRRATSMMAQVALKSERVSDRMISLTWVLAGLAAVQAILAGIQAYVLIRGA